MSLPLRIKALLVVLNIVALASYGSLSYTWDRNVRSLQGNLAGSVPVSAAALSNQFLPVIQHGVPPAITQDAPIWSHAGSPASHEVTLFRNSFSLGEQLDKAELHIFADTRYEVWIDGEWVGRGPARFSLKTREYDFYDLGDLPLGDHLIAVLVQWAPNNRRSESTTPFLQAHIQGRVKAGEMFVGHTGTGWKTLLTDAWQPEAALVHAWELIGPTELLDLRRLPADWMRVGFSDAGWQSAVVKDLSVSDYRPLIVPRFDLQTEETPELFAFQRFDPVEEIVPSTDYQPRSIPLLENVPMPYRILDAGLLSPGRQIVELIPGAGDNPFRFSSAQPTSFSMEILSASNPSQTGLGSVLLDGGALIWQSQGPGRPDVYRATVNNLEVGKHSLDFQHLPPEGLAFSITSQGMQLSDFPFQQGLHAGHRQLLAEPVSQPEAVAVSSADGLNITFNQAPSYVVLELDRTVHGRLVADIQGPAGTIVDIGWDERLLFGTLRPLPSPGSLHPQWNQTDSWILDGQLREISTIDARAGRYILIAVWGSGPVELRNIRVFEERYPLVETGEFNSSNPALDEIWRLGVNTLYPNMTDAYADPWRERGQWWADAYITEHASRVVFGDLELVRRGLRLMREAFTDGRPNALAPNGFGNHMLDYGMLWVYSLQEYYQITGDHLVLKETYPTLKEFFAYLAQYEHPDSGLLDIPEGPWSETAYIDSIGVASRYGQSTALNALYSDTLRRGAAIAVLMADDGSANLWSGKATVVKDQINALLFLPAEGRYISSSLNGEIVPPSPHAQAWPLAYGIVPDERVSEVAGSLLELLSFDPLNPEVQILGTNWVLEGLARSGFIPEAILFLEAYYGQLLDEGARTGWEVYNASRSYTASLSHGWSSSPTWFLTTYVLGARWTSPDTWAVAPAFEGVENASGVIPVGKGILEVGWEQLDCGLFTLAVEAPANSGGELVIPNLGESLEIEVNNKIVWKDGQPLEESVTIAPDGIHIPAAGGTNSATVRAACPPAPDL